MPSCARRVRRASAGPTRDGRGVTRRPALLVDAHGLGDSGLGRYTRELVRHLAARDEFRMIYCAGDPRVLAPWLAEGFAAPSASAATATSATTPISMIPFRHARHSPRVPFAWAAVEAQVEGPRVSWFPHWDGSWRAQPGVTTIHDLIYLSEPGLAGAAKGAVARAWIARMVRASRALMTVSEYSAAQIVAAFPEAAGKLHVVPNGVSPRFFAAARTDGAVGGAPGGATGGASHARPYLLTVGNKRPHKRFETAIRAFALLAAERPELELRMVGNRDASTAKLRELAASLGVAERVHDLTTLDDASLAALYAGAEALLVTSREEGFGLIAAEAMAAGCPVIAVDRGPLREVVGEAGILVPYDDAAAIAAALRGLQAAPLRAARIAAGHAQAARFTWAGAAAALAPVLAAAARD